MRLFADQNLYAATTALLRDGGHDVVTAAELGLARAADGSLLQLAQTDRRILVSRDRDFGHLSFVDGMGFGVIYLRIAPQTVRAVHTELEAVLASYCEPDLLNAFVVVEPGRHRVRRPAA